MLSPPIVKPLKQLNDKAHIVPKNIATMVLRMVAFLRLIFFSSVKNAIATSLIDMVEESDAMNSKKKNSVDHMVLLGN